MFLQEFRVGSDRRRMIGKQSMLFHKLLQGTDISIGECLFKANVLEHIWNLTLLRCYLVFGALS